MAKTKKADTKKNTTKAAAPAPEMPEQDEDTIPDLETPERDEGTAPAPEMPEQDEGTASTSEVPVKTSQEEAAAIAAQIEAGNVAKLSMSESGEITITEPETDMFSRLPNPCVYCGPSVRGIARQYTTYQGGLPDTLRDFIREHPEARQLIVSTEQFLTMRKRLDTQGTAEAKLYKRVKEQL